MLSRVSTILEEIKRDCQGRFGPVLFISLMGMMLLASYAIARPGIESLFLKEYGAEGLPAVWVAVAVAALIVVRVYNGFAGRFDFRRLYGGASFVFSLIFILLMLAYQYDVPHSVFALYVWKDIYIVVLIEIFWSLANVLFETKSARWIYGIFLLAGSFGTKVALKINKIFLIDLLGTEGTLWIVLPLLMLSTLMLKFVRAHMQAPLPAHQASRQVFKEGFDILKRSSYLGFMLLLIALTQVAITLIDYQFNAVVEQAYPLTNERNKVISDIYDTIETCSLLLQALTGFVLRWLGVGRTLFAIPLLLGSAVVLFALVPKYTFAALAKVASKAFDYSIFRAAKEMLYIPLSYREKTQGKAFVDMLTYRVAKGAVSALLLFLVYLDAGGVISFFCLGVIVLWLAVTRLIVRRYQAITVKQSS